MPDRNNKFAGPHLDPLGARPVLPTPDGEPARRAREMFSAYLAETRAYRERDRDEPVAAPQPQVFEAPPPASPRRYDLALTLLGAAGHYDDAVAFDPDATQAGAARYEASAVYEASTTYAPLPPAPESEARPPLGAPAVRPSAPARPAPEAIDQSLLETLADNALLHQNPDGSASFEVSFNDDVFQDLACTIQLAEDGVIATFRALDANTRRLLKAEAGRLRVRLEDRGLKVREVRVASE